MKKICSIVLCVLVFALQGCAAKETTSGKQPEETVTVAPTKAPEATPTVAPTVAPTAALPKDAVLPVTTNDTGKVLIQTVSSGDDYPYNSYIITSSKGESVVVDPYSMPRKEIININPAAIANTHSHYDHNDALFNSDYPDAAILALTPGELKTRDFHIFNIPAAHSGDTITKDYPSNFFDVFEVDGLRIVHMGDCGQTVLTKEQLKALGKIDIAFTQFENSYSDMTLENKKGFKLLEQLNPKIVIPTHYTDNALPIITKKYGKITEVNNILSISKKDLPKGTLKPYRILNTHKYK